MTRIDDQQMVAAAGATTGAFGFVLTTAKAIALELLGVPLPVLLAGLTGACGARVFLEPVAFWRAVAITAFWTLAGPFASQLAFWVASLWLTAQIPPGAQAGMALVISSLGQRFAPIVWENGGRALARYFDSIRNGGGNG